MASSTFKVRHRLHAYTIDAAGLAGGGNVPLGELDAGGKVPANIVAAIDELLASITSDGSGAAYAVRRFGAPGEPTSFVCLVASHPTFDTYQRPASLNHARILCVDSAEASLDIQALIGLAEAFRTVIGTDPRQIRDHLLDETSVTAGAWNVTPLRNVDATLAQTVIENCLLSVNRADAQTVPLPPQPSSLDVLRDVAAAWCSLPWAIQRASPFSVAALAGTRVKLLFTAAGQSPRPVINSATREFAASYIQWLQDRPDDARALIVNPTIQDAQTLASAFQQANEPRVPAAPREEPDMAKNKRPAEAPRGDLNPAMIGYINEQVRKAEESLQDYVDRWMSSSDVPARRTPSGGPPIGAPSSVRPGRRFGEMARASIPGAIAGAAMAFLVVFLMRPHAPATIQPQSEIVETHPARAATATRDAAPAVQPATPTPADKLPGEDWAHRFQNLSDNEPRRLAAVATNIAAVDSPLSGSTEKSFAALRDQLNAGKPLRPQDGKLLRGILFQMLAHQISGREFKIDGRFGPATAAAVPAVKDRLNLDWKGGGSDADIANLEAEAILRWAAKESL